MDEDGNKIKIKIKQPMPEDVAIPTVETKVPEVLEPTKKVATAKKTKKPAPKTAKLSLPKIKSFFTKKVKDAKKNPSVKKVFNLFNKKTVPIKNKKQIEIKKPEIKKEVKKAYTFTLFSGFSIKELTHFFKRLAFLIQSGIPILDSLQMLRKQNNRGGQIKILDSLIEDVSNGRQLSAALSKFQKTFGDFTVSIVRVGELSGTLSGNLTHLSKELEKRSALKRKVIGAIVYPAFITMATIGITTLLTVYIFPKVMPIFISLNVKLPFTTKVLLFLSTFLRDYGLYVLLGFILVLITYFICIRKIKPFHYFVTRTVLRLPLFGRLVQNYNMSNFCRTLSILLKSGFNVVEAVTVTGDSIENPVFKKECYEIQECILKGERISQHFEKRNKLFPDMVNHMVAIGEKSGTLTDSLLYLAVYYESEVDDTIKNMSGLIEPVLMIFMGLVVGFVAVSIITPIYEVTQHLTK